MKILLIESLQRPILKSIRPVSNSCESLDAWQNLMDQLPLGLHFARLLEEVGSSSHHDHPICAYANMTCFLRADEQLRPTVTLVINWTRKPNQQPRCAGSRGVDKTTREWGPKLDKAASSLTRVSSAVRRNSAPFEHSLRGGGLILCAVLPD